MLALGGAFQAIDELKSRLVASQSLRVARIESGEQVVVGVNRFTETAASPLASDSAIETIMTVDPAVERQLIDDVVRWRATRDEGAVRAALDELARVARSSDPADNIMVPTIALAKAGGTTGEWANALRDVFGVYRAPTGVRAGVGRTRRTLRRRWSLARRRSRTDAVDRRNCWWPSRGSTATPTAPSRSPSPRATPASKSSIKGIRLSPEEIVAAARDEDVDVIGLSILSGSHLALVPRIIEGLRASDLETKVVVGGIVPDEDAAALLDLGVVAVYTPKDFSLGGHHERPLGNRRSAQLSRGRRSVNGAALNHRPENRQFGT